MFDILQKSNVVKSVLYSQGNNNDNVDGTHEEKNKSHIKGNTLDSYDEEVVFDEIDLDLSDGKHIAKELHYNEITVTKNGNISHGNKSNNYFSDLKSLYQPSKLSKPLSRLADGNNNHYDIVISPFQHCTDDSLQSTSNNNTTAHPPLRRQISNVTIMEDIPL